MPKGEDFQYAGRAGGEPIDESLHLYICEACGQIVDKRDLAAVLHHERPGHQPIHDAEPLSADVEKLARH